MAEQHAQAWIVEHLYGINERMEVTRRGTSFRKSRLYARDVNVAQYAWALLAHLTGRREKAPPMSGVRQTGRASFERVHRHIVRELAR